MRKDNISFKIAPDGHIRGYQDGTRAKSGASEWQVYPANVPCGALTSARAPLAVVEGWRCLTQRRTELGREMRKRGVEQFRYKEFVPREDGTSNTISTVLKDNMLMRERKFAPLPEELRGKEFDIRRLTPRECFRLMDVGEGEIDTLLGAGISDTQLYKMAGNSIVVACMEGIFRNMFGKCESEPGLF